MQIHKRRVMMYAKASSGPAEMAIEMLLISVALLLPACRNPNTKAENRVEIQVPKGMLKYEILEIRYEDFSEST